MLDLLKRGLLLPLLAILLSFGITACGDDEDTDEPTGQVGDEGSGDGSDDSDDGDDGSDDDDDSDDDGDGDGDDGDVQAVAIEEVEFSSNGDVVTITNRGNTMADLSAYWFCANRQQGGYVALNTFSILSDDGELQGRDNDGALMEIMIPEGESIEVLIEDGLTLSTESDLALYSSNAFGDPDSLVDYLIWGVPEATMPTNRLSEAGTAGQWLGDKIDISDFITAGETPDFLAGVVIEIDDDDGPNDEAGDWDVEIDL